VQVSDLPCFIATEVGETKGILWNGKWWGSVVAGGSLVDESPGGLKTRAYKVCRPRKTV